jgi:signal transduction histidine kinase
MNPSSDPHDLIREIPSPSRRLWLGLCIWLATFGVFAWYTARKIQWLEDYQSNVVQRNRKSSLQLLRLQNDTYLLAISMRDMALHRGAYPLSDWRPAFNRLRSDMDDAAAREAQFAVPGSQSSGLRERLRDDLAALSESASRVFMLAGGGHTEEARGLIEGELESQRASLTAIVARLLVMNDQAQSEAAQTISQVHASVRQDILLVTGLLFLLSFATGLYVLEASRRAFERLRQLAERLDTQSTRLRELSWKLIDVQEQTLREVARDLHDEFGQILTAVGMLLARADRQAKDPGLHEELETARGIVQDTLQKVRDQSQMFRPAMLDDFGLEQTLEWFTRQFSRQVGLDVDFKVDSRPSEFPPEEAIHLYRIVQEALNNVARHAHASRAWVRLAEENGDLTLEIRDNGVGLRSNGAGDRSGPEGLGLIAMRERAEHLKGTLTVQSPPGQGTLIRVRVPLERRRLTTAVG